MKRLIFVAIVSLLVISNLAGCTSISKKMESWMGHNVNDLIASWGPPQQTMSDGQGGQIFIYSQARRITMPGQSTTNVHGYANTQGNLYDNTYRGNTYGSATSTTSYMPAQNYDYNARRMFWIDKSGIIYRWAWKGY